MNKKWIDQNYIPKENTSFIWFNKSYKGGQNVKGI
jgi:hypothetical protein